MEPRSSNCQHRDTVFEKAEALRQGHCDFGLGATTLLPSVLSTCSSCRRSPNSCCRFLQHLATLLSVRPPALANVDYHPAPACFDDMSVQCATEVAEQEQH
jgi:hypothetical protein